MNVHMRVSGGSSESYLGHPVASCREFVPVSKPTPESRSVSSRTSSFNAAHFPRDPPPTPHNSHLRHTCWSFYCPASLALSAIAQEILDVRHTLITAVASPVR
jgi:hypothetical protein